MDMASRDSEGPQANAGALDPVAVAWQPTAGDRVKLKPAEADAWFQPWRDFAKHGREGTVISASDRGYVWVEFDVKRTGARPRRMDFRPKHLIPA